MSPKEALLQDKKAAPAVQDLVDSAPFERAVNTTLLQVIHDMGDIIDPTTAAAAYQRLYGAKAFLAKLRTIADPTPPPPRRSTGDNLSLNR